MLCPFCDHDNERSIAVVDSEYDRNQYWDLTICNICDNSWYEIYTLTSYEVFDKETCKTHSIETKPSLINLMKNWVRHLKYWTR
jgi:hypothetical protein